MAFHVEPTLEGALTDSIHFRIQRNIAQFDGDPRDVAIAGQSAGGISVLAPLISPSSSGPSCKSGSLALNQQPLAAAEAAGETFTNAVG